MEKEKENPRFAINITVSPEEYEFVRLKAYLNRTSMAGFVRRLIARARSKESGQAETSVESHSDLIKSPAKNPKGTSKDEV